MLIHVFASCFPPVISNMAGKSAFNDSPSYIPPRLARGLSTLSFDYTLYIIIPIWKGTQQHPQQHPTIDISYDSSSHIPFYSDILIIHHYTTILDGSIAISWGVPPGPCPQVLGQWPGDELLGSDLWMGFVQQLFQQFWIVLGMSKYITHRIHGAGIYANMNGVYWWDPCYHI